MDNIHQNIHSIKNVNTPITNEIKDSGTTNNCCKNISNNENDFHNLFGIKAKHPIGSQYETNTRADMKDTCLPEISQKGFKFYNSVENILSLTTLSDHGFHINSYKHASIPQNRASS